MSRPLLKNVIGEEGSLKEGMLSSEFVLDDFGGLSSVLCVWSFKPPVPGSKRASALFILPEQEQGIHSK